MVMYYKTVKALLTVPLYLFILPWRYKGIVSNENDSTISTQQGMIKHTTISTQQGMIKRTTICMQTDIK